MGAKRRLAPLALAVGLALSLAFPAAAQAPVNLTTLHTVHFQNSWLVRAKGIIWLEFDRLNPTAPAAAFIELFRRPEQIVLSDLRRNLLIRINLRAGAVYKGQDGTELYGRMTAGDVAPLFPQGWPKDKIPGPEFFPGLSAGKIEQVSQAHLTEEPCPVGSTGVPFGGYVECKQSTAGPTPATPTAQPPAAAPLDAPVGTWNTNMGKIEFRLEGSTVLGVVVEGNTAPGTPNNLFWGTGRPLDSGIFKPDRRWLAGHFIAGGVYPCASGHYSIIFSPDLKSFKGVRGCGGYDLYTNPDSGAVPASKPNIYTNDSRFFAVWTGVRAAQAAAPTTPAPRNFPDPLTNPNVFKPGQTAEAPAATPAPAAKPAVTGQTVRMVDNGSIAWVQLKDGNWAEVAKSTGRISFVFAVQGRSVDEVQFIDRKRSLLLRTNLKENKVYFGTAAQGAATQFLGAIVATSAESRISGSSVAWETQCPPPELVVRPSGIASSPACP